MLAGVPLLEAFGNARTLLSDNSSRFGKFTQLQFGARAARRRARAQLLLERTRIVRAAGERNFHAFYQLLAGADEPTRARLALPASPALVADEPPADARAADAAGAMRRADRAGFAELRAGLDAVASEDEAAAVLDVLGAVLQLGEVGFAAPADDGDASEVRADDAASAAAARAPSTPRRCAPRCARGASRCATRASAR